MGGRLQPGTGGRIGSGISGRIGPEYALGKACAEYQNKAIRNLKCKRIQCDEVWSFCYAKDKNLPHDLKGKFGYGSVWTWTAICADCKLVPALYVGDRNAYAAHLFITSLAGRLACRAQVTTDGHSAYLEAIEGAFSCDVDYAMLIKLYENEPTGNETRYSPAKCCRTRIHLISGKPDLAHISTSYVERQNLTMRMSMRRFTRLANGFSKKVDNLKHAVALHFMHYNFARIHQSLRVTPAMEAGISDHVWSISDLIRLINIK
ncbi:MAG: IS1 family transposase [Acidobacteria bacterium]|nr:IS1 family transposase [Acidobacteriota bacterium]